MRALRYTTAARDDLIAIALYIADESGSVETADAFVKKLEQRCERLAGLPGMLGTPRPELRRDIRSIAQNAYVIFFRYEGACVEVVNVLSAQRDLARYFEN